MRQGACKGGVDDALLLLAGLLRALRRRATLHVLSMGFFVRLDVLELPLLVALGIQLFPLLLRIVVRLPGIFTFPSGVYRTGSASVNAVGCSVACSTHLWPQGQSRWKCDP